MSNACYIIARLRTVAEFDEAKAAGVNAVSVDCYNTPDICNASSKQYEKLKELELSHADITALKAKCDEAKIDLIGTPHSYKDAVFLARIGCAKLAIDPQYLIITEMINSIAKLGKPIILRLGACTWEVVGRAFYAAHCGHHVTMLHMTCTDDGVLTHSEHNLSLIQELARVYPKCVIGYAHRAETSMSWEMAYGLGARVLEVGASDAPSVVATIQWCQELLGSVIRKITPSEEKWREMMEERE